MSTEVRHTSGENQMDKFWENNRNTYKNCHAICQTNKIPHHEPLWCYPSIYITLID